MSSEKPFAIIDGRHLAPREMRTAAPTRQ